MSYLYLLPFTFADKKRFKIGITSKINDRVLHHNRKLKINFEESLIIKADSRIVRFLELELLCTFPRCEDEEILKSFDGYTEVRYIEYFSEALNIIKSKPPHLGITIEKFKAPEKKPVVTRKAPKKFVPVTHTRVYEEDFIQRFSEFQTEFNSLENSIYKIRKRYFDKTLYYDIFIPNIHFNYSKLRMGFAVGNGFMSAGISSAEISSIFKRTKLSMFFPKEFFGRIIEGEIYHSSIDNIVQNIEEKKEKLDNEKVHNKRNFRRIWSIRKNNLKTNSDNFRQTKKPIF